MDTQVCDSRIVNFGSPVYERVQRRINACLRNYRTALRELETLPVAEEQLESLQQPAPAIGFVPHAPVQPLEDQHVGQALPPAFGMGQALPPAFGMGQALPPALPTPKTPQPPQPGGAY